MAHIRSYNSSVLVGNWFEDGALREEIMKDFLNKKENGQLLCQQLKKILGGSDSDVSLSPCPDGFLRFGDRIQLLNAGADPILIAAQKSVIRSPVVINMTMDSNFLKKDSGTNDVINITASPNIKPLSRNIFQIMSIDGTSKGEPVLYGQPFQICSCNEEQFFLCSDTIPMSEMKRKSRNLSVVMTQTNHFNTHWKAEFYHPQFRLENEFTKIPVGKIVILKHLKTNQALSLEKDFGCLTLFGNENEVSAQTFFNDHKVECDVNYWIFSGATQCQSNISGCC